MRESVLHSQLISIGFANGTIAIRPFIPYATVQFIGVVGFFLPNP
jgi:hypothetical protein